MPIPTHDSSCLTKAFPTTCPACNESVWFFSCTCGSKMYFDQLGYPWEIHECAEYRLKREIKLIQDADYLSSEEIYRIITAHEKKSGIEIDEKVLSMVEDILGSRKYEFTKQTVVPFKGNEDISGKVLALNNPVNIFKKLEYEPTVFGKKLLGKIGEMTWAQITVRTRENGKRQCLEYVCYLTQDYLKKNPIRQNDFIVGVMEGVEHRKGIIWVLKSHSLH